MKGLIIIIVLVIVIAICFGLHQSKVKEVGIHGIKFDTGVDTTIVTNESTHIKIGVVHGDVLTDSSTKNVIQKK